MTALGGRICAGNKGSCCCSERSAGEGAAVGMEIPGIVLWFVAKNASRAAWLKPRCLPSGHST